MHLSQPLKVSVSVTLEKSLYFSSISNTFRGPEMLVHLVPTDPSHFSTLYVRLEPDRLNNSSRCLLRRYLRPQDAGTSANSTHLHGGHPSKYYPGPILLHQTGTEMSNVATFVMA
jgi:hypothetical protein